MRTVCGRDPAYWLALASGLIAFISAYCQGVTS